MVTYTLLLAFVFNVSADYMLKQVVGLSGFRTQKECIEVGKQIVQNASADPSFKLLEAKCSKVDHI